MILLQFHVQLLKKNALCTQGSSIWRISASQHHLMQTEHWFWILVLIWLQFYKIIILYQSPMCDNIHRLSFLLCMTNPRCQVCILIFCGSVDYFLSLVLANTDLNQNCQNPSHYSALNRCPLKYHYSVAQQLCSKKQNKKRFEINVPSVINKDLRNVVQYHMQQHSCVHFQGRLFLFIWLFGILLPIWEFFTHMETSPYQWRASNFDLYSALMVMTHKQWWFFSMPHLLWHWASTYNGHLQGPMTLIPVANVWQWNCHYLF